ncbi:hypothetical protein FOZ63_029527 [Perkinsus olseni]|uniref:Cationic amino acid transporter C-terminal domain-containing protein n=1 Tax=Perkinsus olseni TaxID=32597 RepID=A0A7J6QDW1_PEROL|nr:hypothetical protein FOZ63_029527 [Perkinsus olseni]
MFVSIGVGAREAGSFLWISFILAALACGISGLCYCEMSSLVPVAGSAYSYVYTILGELPAAIVLCVDSSISAAAVARAFAAYVNVLLGEKLPKLLASEINIRYDYDLGSSENLWSISLFSFLLCLLLGLLLYRGIKQTSTFNNWSTILNMAVILVFIVGGFVFFSSDIWHPTTPEGIVRGSGRVFFAYLGFDVINCLAEETTEARRLVPRAIIITIVICCVVYVLVAVAFVHLAPLASVSMDAPLATAFEARGATVLEFVVSLGAVGNTMTSVMSSMIVQPRIMLRMSSDGLLPEAIGRLTSSGTPSTALIITIVMSSALALVIDFEALADIVSFGALLSFLAVCLCTMLGRVVPPSVYRQRAAANQQPQEYGKPDAIGVPAAAKNSRASAQLRPHYPREILLMVLFFEVATLVFGALFLHDLVSIFFYLPLFLICLFAGIATSRVVRTYFNYTDLGDGNEDPLTKPFRVPGAPEVPLAGMFINTYMISGLPFAAVLRGLAVMLVAIIFYFAYSIRNSNLAPSGETAVQKMDGKIAGRYVNFENDDDSTSLDGDTEDVI